MWLYKVPLLLLTVGKLSYIQTLDKKDWLFRQKKRIWCEKYSKLPFLGNI